jgi:hypothetical protein
MARCWFYYVIDDQEIVATTFQVAQNCCLQVALKLGDEIFYVVHPLNASCDQSDIL